MVALDRLAERELGAMETLFVQGDAEVSSRATIVMLVRLERSVAYEDVVRAHERVSRSVPHLRRRVVAPVLPVSRPYWVGDPDFDIRYHVRRVRVPGAGSEADLVALVESLGQVPVDPARPLWECTVVEGLADGSGALVYKLHHAIADGQGVMELWASVFPSRPGPVPQDLPPVPAAEDVTRLEVTRQRLGHLPLELVGSAVAALPSVVRGLRTVLGAPRQHAAAAADYAASLQRTLGTAPTSTSPLLQRRSLRRRYLTLDLSLPALKAASRRSGVSLNSTYTAGVLGGLARYHEALDAPVDELLVSLPVSLRRPGDRPDQNRFVGIRVAGPASGATPAERAARVDERVRAARSEPALEAFLSASPLLCRVPLWLSTSLVSETAVRTDVQVSNVPGWTVPVWFGDVPVRSFHGFGPLAGAALMVVMVSIADRCHLGVNVDADAVTDPDLLERCLQEAFDELLETVRDGAAA